MFIDYAIVASIWLAPVFATAFAVLLRVHSEGELPQSHAFWIAACLGAMAIALGDSISGFVMMWFVGIPVAFLGFVALVWALAPVSPVHQFLASVGALGVHHALIRMDSALRYHLLVTEAHRYVPSDPSDLTIAIVLAVVSPPLLYLPVHTRMNHGRVWVLALLSSIVPAGAGLFYRLGLQGMPLDA